MSTTTCQHCAEPLTFLRDQGLWVASVARGAILDGVCKKAPHEPVAGLVGTFEGAHQPMEAATV